MDYENVNTPNTNLLPDEVVAKNTQYYKYIQEKHPGKMFFCSWNWPAFFLGPFWLVYRRCYLGAFIMYIFYTMANMLIQPFGLMTESILINLLLTFIPCILCGMFGNSFYLYFISEKMKKLKNDSPTTLYEKCAPSVMPALVLLAIYFAIVIAVFCFLFGIGVLIGLFASVVAA